MKVSKIFSLLFVILCIVLLTGCRSVDSRMPSEDIEVPKKYSDIITILKDSHLSTNSEEKYEAVKDLLKVVDLTFTRETKTINDLFYHGDAAIDFPNAEQRTIVFNYQYKNDYVRLMFVTMRSYVLRVTVVCTENSMRKYETVDAEKYKSRNPKR